MSAKVVRRILILDKNESSRFDLSSLDRFDNQVFYLYENRPHVENLRKDVEVKLAAIKFDPELDHVCIVGNFVANTLFAHVLGENYSSVKYIYFNASSREYEAINR